MTHEAYRLLSQFPAPMEDEILDSVVSRYHLLSGNPTCHMTMSDLFGIPTAVVPNYFLGKFGYLCTSPAGRALGNVDKVIHQRTLLPAYRHILQPFQARQIATVTCLAQGIGTLTPILFRGRRVMASHYRLCPQCVEVECETHGFAYWHRSHQLYGANVCHIHGCDLITNCRSCGALQRTPRHLELPDYACKSCGKRHLASFSYPSGVLRLAHLAHESLSKLLSSHNPIYVAAALQQRMEELVSIDWSIDSMFDEYSGLYMERECSWRLKAGSIDFLKHLPREDDPLYIYGVGSFARYSDLLVSVDMLFGSWQALELAIVQCQSKPQERIQNALSVWRTPREKTRLLGGSEMFNATSLFTVNNPEAPVEISLEFV